MVRRVRGGGGEPNKKIHLYPLCFDLGFFLVAPVLLLDSHRLGLSCAICVTQSCVL